MYTGTGCLKKRGIIVFWAHLEGVKWLQIKKWKKTDPYYAHTCQLY